MDLIQQRREVFQTQAELALQDWYGHLPKQCEMYKLASIVLGTVFEYFVHPKRELHSINFNDVLKETKDFLGRLRSALNPINPSWLHPEGGTTMYDKTYYFDRCIKSINPEEWLSPDSLTKDPDNLLLLALLEKGKESLYYWPFGDLDDISGEYTRCSWLHCAALDRLIVRAMLFRSIMEFFDYLTHVSLNWNTKKYKTYELKALIKLIVIFIAAFIIGLGISFEYDLWAGIATFFMFAFVIKINNSLTNSKSQQFKLDAYAHLNQLSTLFTLSARRGVSIAYLREQLAKADNLFSKVPSQIFSILDNASARGMVLWDTPVPTNKTNLND